MPSHSSFIAAPARQTPVVFEADLCIAGGPCTGVFAAVRAARMGLKVAVVEQNSLFGGMAERTGGWWFYHFPQ